VGIFKRLLQMLKVLVHEALVHLLSYIFA